MEFDKIWDFVEEKLKTPVPPYIKNIFKACGYNNGITIASIIEDDLKYFVEEVKNGNVAKNFNSIDEKTVFEGSTKTVKDFEFSRGHQKFIMSIVDFIKNHLDQNGPDSFTLALSNKKTVKTGKGKQKTSRKRNFSSVDLLAESSVATNAAHNEPLNGSPPLLILNGLKIHKEKLQTKIIGSLRTHSPEMYLKNVKMINEKIARDLIKVNVISQSEVDSEDQPQSDDFSVTNSIKYEMKYTAEVSCPFCTKTIRVFHVPSASGTYRWNSSNFDRHLKLAHQSLDLNETEIPLEKRPITIKTDEISGVGNENSKVIEVLKISVEKPTQEPATSRSKVDISTFKIDEVVKESIEIPVASDVIYIGENLSDDEALSINEVPITCPHSKSEEEVLNEEDECDIASKPSLFKKIVSYSDSSEDENKENRSSKLISSENYEKSESLTVSKSPKKQPWKQLENLLEKQPRKRGEFAHMSSISKREDKSNNRTVDQKRDSKSVSIPITDKLQRENGWKKYW